MDFNQVRKIGGIKFPQKINRLLQKRFRRESGDFSRYLSGEEDEEADSREEKRQISRSKQEKNKKKKGNSPEEKGRFIDVEV